MCTPKTKLKNHNESYWKHSKPFNSNTTLFLLEHVHWDKKAKTHINIKGSLNSFISDEIRRVCSQFQLPFKQNRILPEPRDNWKGSSMSGMGRFEVSLLPKLHPPQVLLAAYESQPLNPIKPEWLVLVFLPTFFHPLFKSSICEGRRDSDPARFNQELCYLQVYQLLWSFLQLMLWLQQKQINI